MDPREALRGKAGSTNECCKIVAAHLGVKRVHHVGSVDERIIMATEGKPDGKIIGPDRNDYPMIGTMTVREFSTDFPHFQPTIELS